MEKTRKNYPVFLSNGISDDSLGLGFWLFVFFIALPFFAFVVYFDYHFPYWIPIHVFFGILGILIGFLLPNYIDSGN